MDRDEFETQEEMLERLRARRREATAARNRSRRRILFVSLAVLVLAGAAAAFALNRDSGGTPVTAGKTNGGEAKGQKAAPEKAEPVDSRNRDDWRPSKDPVPILMYHPIQPPVPGNPYPDLFLEKRDFVDQVEWLDRSGYVAVTLDEVMDSWFGNGTLPPKPVVLSFDDGYQSQYVNAFPTMEKRGWPGVLNLKAEDSDIYDRQVEEMAAAGWEIASHSTSHPDLTSLSDSQLKEEVVGSRRLLDEEFGIRVDNFCYPAGDYDDRVIAAVRSAGYRSATTTEEGLGRPDDRWGLDRIRIALGDGAEELESKLTAAGA